MIDGAYMWAVKGGKDVLEKVGVWVVCSGIQADGPMRQLLCRSLAPAAERGCDCCGILAKKGSWNATKYLGCGSTTATLAHFVHTSHLNSGHPPAAWPMHAQGCRRVGRV